MSSSRNGGKPRSGSKNGRSRKVELAPEELEALRTACDHYRNSIPIYLASGQSELKLLKTVIRKLS